MRPIVFRDADFKIIDGASHAPLLWALARPGLERIDLWPAGRRACTIGFAWTDGTTGIGHIPWNADATWAWLDQRKAAHLIRHHLATKKA